MINTLLKKTIGILSLLALLALLVSACDFGQEPTPTATEDSVESTITSTTTSTNSEPPTTATQGPSQATVKSTAAHILERGLIRVGYFPFSYKDENGKVVDFNAEIVGEFAKRWLGDQTDVDFIDFSERPFDMLANGDFDLVLFADSYQRELDEHFDFSQTYYIDSEGKPYRIGVPQGDSDFREFVNFTLQDMKYGNDPTYDRIYKKSFDNVPYEIEILPPGKEAHYTKLESLPEQITSIGTENSSKINEIRARGQILVGYNPKAEPFTFKNDEGKVDGFEADLMREFARRWLELDSEQAVDKAIVFTDTSHLKDRIDFIVYGTVDLMASALTHNRARDERIDFSQTYHLDGQKLLVHKNSGINKLEDLKGQSVGVVDGSTAETELEKFNQKLEDENDAIKIVDKWESRDELVNQLLNNNIKAVLSDAGLLFPYEQRYSDTLAIVGEPLTEEPYAIGLRMNDYRLRELVNFTLQDMKRDGTYDELYRKWFGNDPNETPYAVETPSGNANYLADKYGIVLSQTESISTIQRIQDRGYLIAGVKYDFPPFGELKEDGKVVGFDVDLIQAMADEWGVEAKFEQVTSENRIEKLAAGEVDIVAASMTHTKERDETIDFSQTYFLDGQTLLVRKDSGIEGIEGLDNKTVAAVTGSTSIDQIQAHADVNDVSFQDVISFTEYLPAVEAFRAGQVDALTTDKVALSQLAKKNDEWVVVGEPFTEEPYGMGLPPGDSYFNNLVNFTLQNLKDAGTYNELYKKWFGEESTPYPVEILPGEWPHTFAHSPTTLDIPVESKVDEKLLSEECGFAAGVKYDFPPFGFLDEKDGKVKGFDVDIVKEFAKRWCGDENKVELVQVTSENRIPKLAAGQVDILAASMTHKKERDETIDFSQTYFLDGQSLLIREGEPITDVIDLNLKTVAVISGSTSIDNIQIQAKTLGIKIEPVPFLEYPPAIEALKAGQVDALTTDEGALLYHQQKNSGLVVVGEPFTKEPYGIGVPNYDYRFRDLVNFTLQEMKVDGTYDRLYQKWFPGEQPYPVEVWPGESYIKEVNMVPMLRIKAGEFLRGRNNQNDLRNESPEQTILLDEFYIDQYEVTNRLYAQCVIANYCNEPKLERSVVITDYYVNSDFANYPVVNVTWENAKTYCEFVGKQLPTEAQWEKAARGATGLTYPWGDQEPTLDLANFNNTSQGILPVGSFPAGISPYGVHDMAGNVREWVADWYQKDYYENPSSENPQGPDDGITKVVRGGAWNDTNKLDVTTTRRKDFSPDVSDRNLGFRCASSSFPPRR